MKSVFRKAWLALVALSVVVVGACCSYRNRSDIKLVKDRIAELKERLSEREMSCVYGPPEMIQEYGRETSRMRTELEELEKELERLKKCD